MKKFLDKEVRIAPFLKQPLAFPTIPQSFVMFYFTMLGYIFGIDCQTTLQVQGEAYKSQACRNLCTITLLLLCQDTGPAVRILGNIGALQKYQFRDETKVKKLNYLSSY